MTQTGRI